MTTSDPPNIHGASALKPEKVLEEVEKICAHPAFAKSQVLQRFLRFTVSETLAGRGSDLKEYAVALSAFGREQDFDPRHSSVVRTQARNLRSRLEDYYLQNPDAIRIVYSPGGYAPAFITASAEQPAAPAHRTHWITRHPQADRIVSRARSLRRTGNHAAINEAIALLTELTVSIPDCGPAFAALSLCYSLREDAQLYCGLEAKARTKTLAMQALALAPDCAESWIALGCARLFFDWDFRHGHECLEQARALDPADGLASALLASFFHLRQGDFSEADVLLMEAVRLSPGDAVVQFLRAWSLFCQRRYPESLAVLEVQAKMSPPSALAAGLLPWVLAFSGKRLRAMDATACMPQSQEWMRAWLLLRGGVQEEATLLLQAFEAGQTGPEVSDLFPTLLLAETGNCEHAAALLARAARKRLPYALFVERDPRFDSIRDIRSSVETQSIS